MQGARREGLSSCDLGRLEMRAWVLVLHWVRVCDYVASSNLNIHYTCKSIKNPFKNNKFDLSAPIWNGEFELFVGSYSVSNIQDYFQYTFKKHVEKTHK